MSPHILMVYSYLWSTLLHISNNTRSLDHHNIKTIDTKIIIFASILKYYQLYQSICKFFLERYVVIRMICLYWPQPILMCPLVNGYPLEKYMLISMLCLTSFIVYESIQAVHWTSIGIIQMHLKNWNNCCSSRCNYLCDLASTTY